MIRRKRSRMLVTGGAGFIGCNLCDRLAREGHEVLVLDTLARAGVERNLDWLMARHATRIRHLPVDVRDRSAVAAAVGEADAVFHLAAQVAVTTSLVDPGSDFDINVRGTLNLLESVRGTGKPFIFASTNKVYGDLSDVPMQLSAQGWVPRDRHLRGNGVDETRRLDFHTPYGCSKGAADQYVLDYARSFGVPSCVLRMSCIYGPHQMGTEDQGWVAHFLIRALADEPITLFGDGHQVRDILHVDDAAEAYVSAWRKMELVRGRAFNLGGGPANAVSLRQLISFIQRLIGRPVALLFGESRAGDQRYFVADTAAVRTTLGLPNPISWEQGVADLADWLARESGRGAARQTVAA